MGGFSAAAPLACLALAGAGVVGCGGSDAGPTSTGAATAAAGSASQCVGSFNADAPDNLPRLARLAHKQGNDLLVGAYDGPAFSAETYDVEIASGDGAKTKVEPGACVVTEITGGLGPLYLFAVGDDGGWHNLSVSDPAVTLAKDPQRQLADARSVQLSNVDPPAVPSLVAQG